MVRLFRSKPQKSDRRGSVASTARRTERATAADMDARYSFRRSQTITGSASSQVSTLSEQQAQLKSPRVQAHDLSRHRRRLGISLLAVLVVSGVLAFLVSQFTAVATIVVNADESNKGSVDYTSSIEQYFANSPIERFRFMMNNSRLQRFIQSQHPEVKTIVDDGSSGLGKSRFVFQMRSPVVGWMIDGKEEYVDRSGVAFFVNYSAAPSVQIVDQSGVQSRTGQALASNSFLSFVGQVVGLSSSLEHLAVTQVVIPSGKTREVDVTVSGVSYPIRLSTDRPAGEQVEDMARAITWMRQHGVTPQYIDVRVSRDAFYR